MPEASCAGVIMLTAERVRHLLVSCQILYRKQWASCTDGRHTWRC